MTTIKDRAPSVVKFRVYPAKPSRLFFHVRIFPTVTALRRYLLTHTMKRSLGRRGLAMCSTWAVISFKSGGRRARTSPEMGEIVLARGYLGTEIVCHESAHAALGWVRRIKRMPPAERYGAGLIPADHNDELFCEGLGQIARQIAVQLWARKLVS